MWALNIIECAEISGGLTKNQVLVASAAAFLAGGTACAYVAGAFTKTNHASILSLF